MKQLPKLKWRSLLVQISLYFLLTMTFLLIFYGISTSRNSSAIILDRTEEDTEMALKRSSEYVNDYVKRLKQVSSALAKNTDIQSYLATENSESKAKALAVLNTVLATDDSLVSATLITNEGQLTSNEDQSNAMSIIDEAWYQQAITQEKSVQLIPVKKEKLLDNEERWGISLIQEVVSDKGHKLGVIHIEIDYQGIASYLNQLSLGTNGYLFIIDHDQKIIYHPNIQNLTDHGIQQQLQADTKRADGYDKETQQLVYHQDITEADWQLVGIVSLEEIGMVSRNMRQMLFLVGGLIFIVVSIGSLLVFRGLTKPIRRLEHSMTHVASGLRDAKVEESGSDEIRSLARNFNFMLIQMDKLVSEGQAKEKAIHKYELQTLASQINPHFLYNTLETIIWMAEFNDSEKVVETTKSLANFFRLALNQGNEIISLKDEINHVRQYLFIQQQRYGEQLTYEINEDPAIFDYKLPKLVVQPIVENAIYHGIKEIKRQGVIHIQTRTDGNSLYIEIRDNGKGYFPKKKAHVESSKLGGIGLSNIDERLRLQYGDHYEMIIKTEQNQYTLVILKLPYQ